MLWNADAILYFVGYNSEVSRRGDTKNIWNWRVMDARLVGDEERGNKMNDKLKNKNKTMRS